MRGFHRALHDFIDYLIPSVTLCVTPPLEHQGEARDRRLKSNRDILAALRALLPSRQAVPPPSAGRLGGQDGGKRGEVRGF